MRIIIFLLVIAVITASCNSKPSSAPAVLNVKKDPLKTENISSQGQVVLRFYNWFLRGPYLSAADNFETPAIKLTKDSIYQIAFETQFDSLKHTGYFSKDFFKNQLQNYNACNIQLKKVNTKDVDKCGCSPVELIEGNDCDFLTYNSWTGGQGETLNKVTILKTQMINDVSKVTVALGDKNEVYSRPEVILTKEDGEWRISRITIRYN